MIVYNTMIFQAREWIHYFYYCFSLFTWQICFTSRLFFFALSDVETNECPAIAPNLIPAPASRTQKRTSASCPTKKLAQIKSLRAPSFAFLFSLLFFPHHQ